VNLRTVIVESRFGPLVKRLKTALSTPRIRKIRLQDERYDQQTISVMRRVLSRDSCCVDVGAHSGAVLRHIVALAPNGTHFAFEPLPHLAALLQKRFPSVVVSDSAVSDVSGSGQFMYVKNAAPYSGLRRRLYDRSDVVIERIPVRVTTLDEAVPDVRIAFIKLDIEGGEFHAIRGARKILGRSRPIVVFECGPRSTGQYGVAPGDMYRLWVGFGYQVSSMQRWLDATAPYGETEFGETWHSETEFYFIAYPAG